MTTELTADSINHEPIQNILSLLKAQWVLNFQWNRLLLEWKFSTRYRFSEKFNTVTAFNIEMPHWQPFNFIKSLLFSDLSDKEAISETYNWYRGYFWLENNFKWDLKMNSKLIAEINKNAQLNKIKAEKEQKLLINRRKTFWIKFARLKNYFSNNTLDYFSKRWISKETLEKNNARTWLIIHNWKTYKNRLFLPIMNEEQDIVWVKMRNIYAKDSAYKSMNITDSWSWLLYNKEDIEWQDTIYFCEWEMDKMSMDEASITNSIWNMMWANTFNINWKSLFKDCKNINILYDFDKNSLAWLQWVRKIMSIFPEKDIKFMDLPKYLESNFPENREELLDEYSDINDVWCLNKILWVSKEKFKQNLDNSLSAKSIEELSEIINHFKIQKKEEKNNEVWTFKISFKTKVKSLDDYVRKIS